MNFDNPKPLYNLTTNKGRLHCRPRYELKGWHGFCTGGILAGITAHTQSELRNNPPRQRQFKKDLLRRGVLPPVPTIAAYFGLIGKKALSSYLCVPRKYIHDYILYNLWLKSTTGEGGADMWGGNQYASKIFALGDRARRNEHGVSCHSFARYLKEHKDICRMVGLGRTAGAHGGEGHSWLFTIYADKAEKYFNGVLDELNEHLLYLNNYAKELRKKDEYKDIVEIQTEDKKIHGLWV